MPLEGLDEGLPKNPDLALTELKFLLTVKFTGPANKENVWGILLKSIKDNGDYT